LVSFENESAYAGRTDEPQPDVALLKPRADRYASTPCTAADALLVIEVADSSIAYDTRLKAKLYASNGIAAYWVVDLQNRRLICHSEPQADGFASIQTLTEPGVIELPGLPGVQADFSGLL
jgi:Uma2 family endonuclease